MVNGDLLLGLRPVDAERADDRFDPFRCGLEDHVSFAVVDWAALEAAAQAFTERGVATATSPSCHPSASWSCRSRTPTGWLLSSPPRCSRPSRSLGQL